MKNILKALTTLVAGVSLGMLFAPEKGKELRKKLEKSSDKMGDFGTQLMSAAQDASVEVKKFLQKKEVKELIELGQNELKELLQLSQKKGNNLSQKAKKEVEKIVETLEEKVGTAQKKLKKKAVSLTKPVKKKAVSTKK